MSCGYAPPSPSIPSEGSDWWHRVELPGGYVPPLIDELTASHEPLRLPDLTGKTVLDVCAHDGHLSFAAERLGAARVVALDALAWSRPDGKGRFEYAKRALASKVEDVEMEVLDISPETVGEFDVVLFIDVLPRMRHPLLALERVAGVTKERLVVETLVDMSFVRSPAAAFYPSSTPDEETNLWGPNRAAVVGMLSYLGFDHAAAFPAKRLTRARLRSLPARLKVGVDLLAMAPGAARPRLRRDLVKILVKQNRLVAHGWREPRP